MGVGVLSHVSTTGTPDFSSSARVARVWETPTMTKPSGRRRSSASMTFSSSAGE